MRARYTPEQLEYLGAANMSLTVPELTTAFNARFGSKKTAAAIKSALQNHKLRCGVKKTGRPAGFCLIYTNEEAKFLRENYEGRSLADLTAIFNKRFKADKTLKQIKSFTGNRGIKSGRTGHFEKGHVPFNAGTKGFMKANKTSFKKGNNPPNRKPLGSERICPKDGFILVEVAEHNPYTGATTRFKHKHVVTWEREHGPVPSGKVVAFRDSDVLNCHISNLMLLSRAELLQLNRLGYKKTEKPIKPSVLLLAKLKTKTFERRTQGHEA